MSWFREFIVFCEWVKPGLEEYLVKYNVPKSDFSKVLLEPCVFTVVFLCVFGISWFPVKNNVFMCFFPWLYPSQLGDKKTFENTGFWHYSDAEPCVFTAVVGCRFSKPCVFAVVLARFSFAVAQWITARATDLLKTIQKKQGFENVRNIMHDKKQGSAWGSHQTFVFYSTFSSRRWMPIKLAGYICPTPHQ